MTGPYFIEQDSTEAFGQQAGSDASDDGLVHLLNGAGLQYLPEGEHPVRANSRCELVPLTLPAIYGSGLSQEGMVDESPPPPLPRSNTLPQ